MKVASEMGAVRVRGEIVSIVGRARQENGRVLCAFRNENNGVQLHAVAHGNHHFTPGVIEAIGDGRELRSEERRVGKECRSRRGPKYEKKKETWTGLKRGRHAAVAGREARAITSNQER